MDRGEQMKKLPDLDIDHPFYSDEADKKRKVLLKILEKEEKELVEENRRRYKNRSKNPVEEGEGNNAGIS